MTGSSAAAAQGSTGPAAAPVAIAPTDKVREASCDASSSTPSLLEPGLEGGREGSGRGSKEAGIPDRSQHEAGTPEAERHWVFRIGYCLSAKKAASFLGQGLIDLCRKKHVLFVKIDRTKPLEEQPGQAFDAILHKDCSSDWARQLEDYTRVHPQCVLLDHPRHIVPLHNRVSMLECVDSKLLRQLKLASPDVTLKVPQQVAITTQEALFPSLEASGMKFPLVAKPLVADGSQESHRMFLVLNSVGLSKLRPPLVLQEFVNHGGVIFKVYVVGNSAICTPRRSLQDCVESDLDDPTGVVGFSQISNIQQQRQHHLCPRDEDPELHLAKQRHLPRDNDGTVSAAVLPDQKFVQELSALLRVKLSLTLFNYDLIQDTQNGEYYIVDINYFPGFAKMPRYEDVLSDYFAHLGAKRHKGGC